MATLISFFALLVSVVALTVGPADVSVMPVMSTANASVPDGGEVVIRISTK